jgi:transcriptional regulator with XRE-family HTH domain
MRRNLALDVLDELIEGEVTTGSLIRSRRQTLGLTQQEVADMTGLQATFISAIENDKKSLGVQVASKIATAIGLHPATILFPHGIEMSKELKEIEKKRKKILKGKVA